MEDRLFVSVLGNRNSGKSTTWNTLFGAKVRTGKTPRKLMLYDRQCVDVFLVSGSPEERKEYAGDILADQTCRIVLCSIQYTEKVRETLNHVTGEGFDLFVQWLNPGHKDVGENFDRLGLIDWLLANDATVAMRDGRRPPRQRTEEIRQFVYGWAKARGLASLCP